MLFDEFLRRFRYVSRSYNKIEHSHSYLFRFFLFDKLHKEKKTMFISSYKRSIQFLNARFVHHCVSNFI